MVKKWIRAQFTLGGYHAFSKKSIAVPAAILQTRFAWSLRCYGRLQQAS